MKWSNAIEDFGYYLGIERGLSENTIINYQLDLKALVQFLENHGIDQTPINIKAETLQQFIYEEAKEKSAYSQSRRIRRGHA